MHIDISDAGNIFFEPIAVDDGFITRVRAVVIDSRKRALQKHCDLNTVGHPQPYKGINAQFGVQAHRIFKDYLSFGSKQFIVFFYERGKKC